MISTRVFPDPARLQTRDTPLFLHATEDQYLVSLAIMHLHLQRGAHSTLIIQNSFDYSRVKFVVHYFLCGSLSESDHSPLNSAGTAARTTDGSARAY